MCGFLGSVTVKPVDISVIKNCNKRIECRGPDEKIILDNKYFGKSKLFHNLAFNRLSIIDLSKNASQPMYSDEFNSIIMFNGEIFNHRELRAKLEKEKVKFKTSHSDTETLLNGLSKYGIDFLDLIVGQFSIYFNNIDKNEYFLIRDRTGQKPLYYSLNTNNFYFGSDLLSVKNISGSNVVNNEQIINYLNFGTSISPNTYFQNIFSVEPGEVVKITTENNALKVFKHKYWNIEDFQDEKVFNFEEFIDLFEDSVYKRLESDVPVSIFLSGGLDSTAVIKAAKKFKPELSTFSMITDSKNYNESEFMNQVVKKYETNHKFEMIDKNISFSEIKSIISKLDDVIYDPSIIPTYILSNRISKNFKVALSGDGGDELLSGYLHYINYHRNVKIPESISNYLYNLYSPYLGTGNNILKFSNNWKTAYSSFYSDKKLLSILKIKNFDFFEDIYLSDKEPNWKSLMVTDLRFFLNELMLKKIDKSSMLNSLEVRSPFLDHRLFQYIISHQNYEMNKKFSSKKIIKDYLSEDFGESFLKRKKMGFSIDISSIIKLNFEEVVSTILDSRLDSYIDLSSVQNIFTYKSRINSIRLWKIYCLAVFLEKD